MQPEISISSDARPPSPVTFFVTSPAELLALSRLTQLLPDVIISRRFRLEFDQYCASQQREEEDADSSESYGNDDDEKKKRRRRRRHRHRRRVLPLHRLRTPLDMFAYLHHHHHHHSSSDSSSSSSLVSFLRSDPGLKAVLASGLHYCAEVLEQQKQNHQKKSIFPAAAADSNINMKQKMSMTRSTRLTDVDLVKVIVGGFRMVGELVSLLLLSSESEDEEEDLEIIMEFNIDDDDDDTNVSSPSSSRLHLLLLLERVCGLLGREVVSVSVSSSSSGGRGREADSDPVAAVAVAAVAAPAVDDQKRAAFHAKKRTKLWDEWRVCLEGSLRKKELSRRNTCSTSSSSDGFEILRKALFGGMAMEVEKLRREEEEEEQQQQQQHDDDDIIRNQLLDFISFLFEEEKNKKQKMTEEEEEEEEEKFLFLPKNYSPICSLLLSLAHFPIPGLRDQIKEIIFQQLSSTTTATFESSKEEEEENKEEEQIIIQIGEDNSNNNNNSSFLCLFAIAGCVIFGMNWDSEGEQMDAMLKLMDLCPTPAIRGRTLSAIVMWLKMENREEEEDALDSTLVLLAARFFTEEREAVVASVCCGEEEEREEEEEENHPHHHNLKMLCGFTESFLLRHPRYLLRIAEDLFFSLLLATRPKKNFDESNSASNSASNSSSDETMTDVPKRRGAEPSVDQVLPSPPPPSLHPELEALLVEESEGEEEGEEEEEVGEEVGERAKKEEEEEDPLLSSDDDDDDDREVNAFLLAPIRQRKVPSPNRRPPPPVVAAPAAAATGPALLHHSRPLRAVRSFAITDIQPDDDEIWIGYFDSSIPQSKVWGFVRGCRPGAVIHSVDLHRRKEQQQQQQQQPEGNLSSSNPLLCCSCCAVVRFDGSGKNRAVKRCFSVLNGKSLGGLPQVVDLNRHFELRMTNEVSINMVGFPIDEGRFRSYETRLRSFFDEEIVAGAVDPRSPISFAVVERFGTASEETILRARVSFSDGWMTRKAVELDQENRTYMSLSQRVENRPDGKCRLDIYPMLEGGSLTASMKSRHRVVVGGLGLLPFFENFSPAVSLKLFFGQAGQVFNIQTLPCFPGEVIVDFVKMHAVERSLATNFYENRDKLSCRRWSPEDEARERSIS